MTASSEDTLKRYLLGVSVGLLLGFGHGIHDLLAEDRAVAAFLPTLPITLQTVALSWGQSVAERKRWSRLASLALAVLASTAFGAITLSLHMRVWSADSRASAIAFGALPAGLGVLAFWVLLIYFPDQLNRARMRAVSAESECRKAELTRLRASLHPHFLLNTLNAVAGLLVVEPIQARKLVIALGELLRDSLEDDGEMRSLEQEVAWLRRYSEIFEIRHRGAIRFEWDLADDTLDLAMPRLLLQPLLENSIEHGVLQRPGGGTVVLRSRTVADRIRILVSDDGPGWMSDNPSGLGLRLVEQRLQLAYPNAGMSIDTGANGTCITLDIPSTGRCDERTSAH